MNNLELKFLAVDSQLELFSNFFPKIHDSEVGEKLTTEIHHVLANSDFNLPPAEPVVELENKTLRQIILGESGSSSGKSNTLPNIPSSSKQNGAHEEVEKNTKTYKCKICDKSYQFPSYLQRHVNSSHANTETSVQFNCNVCGKRFPLKTGLSRHMITHGGNESRLKCDICDKYFHPQSMKKHHLIHTGEKPFKCLICNKHFRQRNSLKTHKCTHTSKMPFHCIFCNKNFNQPNNLKKHLLLHTGKKPCEGLMCGKSFRYSFQLKSHMKTHEHKSAPP